MEEFVMELLDSRENRRLRQEDLSRKYKATIVSFTLNTPGIEKDNVEYRDIHELGYKRILEQLEKRGIFILYKDIKHKKTGSDAYIVVDYDSIEVKNIMVNIEENHRLGRIFDIDVFDNHLNQISRKKIGKDKRKCILCDKDAKTCIRQGNHNIDDIKEGILKIWRDNIGKL